MLTMSAAPTSAAIVVVKPIVRERVQPLHPRLAKSDSEPRTKPTLMIMRGREVIIAAMNGGAAGWVIAVNMVAATTVTMNATAEATARPIVVVINRLWCPSVRRVARNVAAKPPRKALSAASCEASAPM